MPVSKEALIVGCEVKHVTDLLFESRKPWTAQQINERVDERVKGNKAFFEALAKSPKIKFDGHCYSYKCMRYLRDQRLLARKLAQADLNDATLMEQDSSMPPISNKHKMKMIHSKRPDFSKSFDPEFLRCGLGGNC